MRIYGFDGEQLAALCEMWKLGTPIDVSAFLDRSDIPEHAKESVRSAPNKQPLATDAEKYHLMQAQIIIEIAKLDREKWQP